MKQLGTGNQSSMQKQEERKQKRARRDRKMYAILAVLLIALAILTTKVFASTGDSMAPEPKSKEIALETKVEKTSVEVTEPVTKEKAEEKEVVVKEEKTPAQPKKTEKVQKAEKGFSYNEDVPMPKAHQEYLYELTTEYGLDYVKTLAVIQHESVFDPNATNETQDYGYFQINIVNHQHLSELLGTQNAPFDPYVNMEWGTYMLSDLYAYWSEQGYQGQGLDDAVWSSYNKGKAGFLKYGHATEYIHKMKASIQKIESVM